MVVIPVGIVHIDWSHNIGEGSKVEEFPFIITDESFQRFQEFQETETKSKNKFQ